MKTRQMITLLLLLSIIGLLSWQISEKASRKAQQTEERAHLPDFTLLTLTGEQLNTGSIAGKQQSIFIFFDPDCSICAYEAENAHRYITQYAKNTSVVWVGAERKAKVAQFVTKYRLDTLPRHFVLIDSSGLLAKKFGVRGVPQILIYNEQGTLAKQFRGETTWEGMLKYLKKSS
jgi:peroxiredoxin